MSTSTFWFLAVGGSAALTHMGVFALVQAQMWPELANALGFVVAFFVSFAGHRWLSFQDAGTSIGTSLQRFAVTALGGFATNELVFVLLLALFTAGFLLFFVLFVSELFFICLDALADYFYRNIASAQLLDYRLLALEHFVYAEKVLYLVENVSRQAVDISVCVIVRVAVGDGFTGSADAGLTSAADASTPDTARLLE